MKFKNEFSKKIPDNLGWNLSRQVQNDVLSQDSTAQKIKLFCKWVQQIVDAYALLTTESSWTSGKIKQLLLNLFLFLGWSLTWQTTKGRGNYFLALAVNPLILLMLVMYVRRFKKLNKKKIFFSLHGFSMLMIQKAESSSFKNQTTHSREPNHQWLWKWRCVAPLS